MPMRFPSGYVVDKHMSEILLHLNDYVGVELTEDMLVKLVTLVVSVVERSKKLDGECASAALESLAHMEGKNMPRSMIVSNVTRLVANWPFVKDKCAIPFWDGTLVTSEIVVLGLANIPPGIGDKARRLVRLKLKTGLPAGIIKWSVLYDSTIRMFFDKESGCAKYNCAIEELSGMRFQADVSQSGQFLKIRNMTAGDRARKQNRELTEKRLLVDKCGTPVPCNICAKTVLECPLAVWWPKQENRNE